MLCHSDVSCYDSDSVAFRLNFPPVIQIRERAASSHLLKKLKVDKNVVQWKIDTVKEVWHFFLNPIIKKIINKKVENSFFSSPFTVEANVSYEKNQEECIEL